MAAGEAGEPGERWFQTDTRQRKWVVAKKAASN
jgi:hypothetical protein